MSSPVPNSPWGVAALAARRHAIAEQQRRLAPTRPRWVERNRYFYRQVHALFRFLVEPNRRVLHLRSGSGDLLAAVQPSRGCGVELTEETIAWARERNPQGEYRHGHPDEFVPDTAYDYIIASELGEVVDVQRMLRNLRSGCERHTRLLLHTYNHLWEPVLALATRLGLKVPQEQQNWLAEEDLKGMLELEGWEWLKTYRVVLFPKWLPLLGFLFNRVAIALPFVNRLALVKVLVARPRGFGRPAESFSVSVVIPCRNEKGNVRPAVERIPRLGRETEILFCDDRSTDGTAEEVEAVMRERPDLNIRLVQGPGVCKALNVWTGFKAARGDVLMILDADLAVMPEELPYFLEVLAANRAEFVNGSRLIYPVPRSAMRPANMIGNKFFSVVFSYLLGQRIKDTLCGTKVIFRTDWERIQPLIDTWGCPDRWGDYELLFGAAKLNLAIRDLPVHYQERVYGTTKMTKRFRNGLIMLRFCWAAFKRLKLQLRPVSHPN